MLIEFSVENFKSLKEKQTLSMESANNIHDLDYNLIDFKDRADKDYLLLKTAALYGANSSGKSNVLDALMRLKKLVKSSHNNQKGDELPHEPFQFDKGCVNTPTIFDITFIHDGIKYNYGVSYTEKKVTEEYLYYYPKGRKSQIFERQNTDEFKFNKDKEEQQIIKERTRKNVLYLSSSTQFNYDKTSKVFDWFDKTLNGIGPKESPHLTEFTFKKLDNNETFKKRIKKALNVADFGISDIKGYIKTVPIEKIKDLPPEIKKLGISDGELKTMEIQTVHELEDVEGILPFFLESEGTKRFFSLIGPIITALENGDVLVLDELDTKLHHSLNKFIVELFHDPEENPNGAQLIFTTHNTNLLDQDLFRRDQIWFTEMDPKTGSTDLYSLIEFSPRKDKDIEKGYLVGRYGAIPFIGDKKILKEGG